MSEFITIQVGQCGNQIGSVLWPQILKEYNVAPQNSLEKISSPKTKQQHPLTSFFNIPNSKKSFGYNCVQELLNKKIRARAVCIDMEDSVVARFKTGSLKGLFDEKCMVTNYPGSGNNWAEGFCEYGPAYEEEILQVIRRSVEVCDNLHGFLMLFSTGGGTGSGLGTYTLKLLTDLYPKIERFVSCVYSTGTEDVITCPYNNALATQQLLENATCVFPIENRCLLDIASRKMQNNFQKTRSSNLFKPFEDMNSIIVEMLLHLTSGSRFPGSLNFDMNEINTNMIPFPQLNFLSSGFHHAVRDKKLANKAMKEEMFLASCNRTNQLIKVDPLNPKSVLLASTIIGRGVCSVSDLQSYTNKLQSKAQFTAWSKKSVKTGLCNVAPIDNKVAIFSLFNTTGLYNLFDHIYDQFNKLYRKKAHLHHYTKIDQFDDNYFLESAVALQNVMANYKELENLGPVDIARLKPVIE